MISADPNLEVKGNSDSPTLQERILSFTDPDTLFSTLSLEQKALTTNLFWYHLSGLYCLKGELRLSIQFLKDGYIRTYYVDNIDYVNGAKEQILKIKQVLLDRLGELRESEEARGILKEQIGVEKMSNYLFKKALNQLENLLAIYLRDLSETQKETVTSDQDLIIIDLNDRSLYLRDSPKRFGEIVARKSVDVESIHYYPDDDSLSFMKPKSKRVREDVYFPDKQIRQSTKTSNKGDLSKPSNNKSPMCQRSLINIELNKDRKAGNSGSGDTNKQKQKDGQSKIRTKSIFSKLTPPKLQKESSDGKKVMFL